jgi:hypothetical protein
MLTQLELTPSREGGKMEMEGLARDVDALNSIYRALQDDKHQVVGEGQGQSSTQQRYSARFDGAVILGNE